MFQAKEGIGFLGVVSESLIDRHSEAKIRWRCIERLLISAAFAHCILPVQASDLICTSAARQKWRAPLSLQGA